MRTCFGVRSSFRIVSSISGQLRGNVVRIRALLGSSATTLTSPSTTPGSPSTDCPVAPGVLVRRAPGLPETGGGPPGDRRDAGLITSRRSGRVVAASRPGLPKISASVAARSLAFTFST